MLILLYVIAQPGIDNAHFDAETIGGRGLEMTDSTNPPSDAAPDFPAGPDSPAAAGEGDALARAMAWPGLWVYDRRDGVEGVWTPPFGDLPLPEGWAFLPPGEVFVTRKVKAGPHWVLKGKLHRRPRYHPLIGYYAPAAAIAAARAAAQQTQARREQARERSTASRERAEDHHRAEFHAACLRFLDFAPKHAELAERIARETTERACQKYSGRVGRTGKLPLDDKVALAVRACIRHRHTDYDERVLPDESSYQSARSRAHEDVDQFLRRHRPPE
jgi:hypothetical protein